MSKIKILQDRAAMFAQARAFFAQRGVVEVDCPALSHAACVDTHIDVMSVEMGRNQTGYLHTSPEYGMKRLLAQGMEDIYQLSHVFRKGELSARHEPEFTMVEWYRRGFSFEKMINETLAFTHLFLGERPSQTFTYREVVQEYAGIDYVSADTQALLRSAEKQGLELSQDTRKSDRDTLLQCLMSFLVEPKLPHEKLIVIRDYPATQAALAKTHLRGDEEVAERFEIYFNGLELANGYHELADAKEQKRRFEEANVERQKLGKEALPIDENFLAALKRGLPDCCGVAVGFDRLMMLRHGVIEIQDVIP
ncbi:MAG: EF-P lysine aminoacylase EpmA [Nitrososphaerales archaeon]